MQPVSDLTQSNPSLSKSTTFSHHLTHLLRRYHHGQEKHQTEIEKIEKSIAYITANLLCDLRKHIFLLWASVI